MITLNVCEILAKEAARQEAIEKGLPVLPRLKGSEPAAPAPPAKDPDPALIPATPDKQLILGPLWQEFGHIKRQRGKLSSSTAFLVDEIEKKLTFLDPPAAYHFMQGGYCSNELKAHYAAIQSWSDKALAIYDQIQYVEAYGKLPATVNAADPTVIDLQQESAMKNEIRRLDDLIYKTKKKLEQKPLSGKKSPRETEWKNKVALAEAARYDLKEKLKRKQYEARTTRMVNSPTESK